MLTMGEHRSCTSQGRKLVSAIWHKCCDGAAPESWNVRPRIDICLPRRPAGAERCTSAGKVSAPLVEFELIRSQRSQPRSTFAILHAEEKRSHRPPHFRESDLHLINGRDTESDKSGRDFRFLFKMYGFSV